MTDITSSFNEIKIDGNNNKIIIGSNDNFEPAVNWLMKKTELKVKSADGRYLPNNTKYENININVSISNLLYCTDNTYIRNYITKLFTDFISNYFLAYENLTSVSKNPTLKGQVLVTP